MNKLTQDIQNILNNPQDKRVGNMSLLKTTKKDTLVNSINELFQSASNGKTLVANAITGKGVPSNSNMTFQQLATNISNIKTNDSDIYYEFEWSGRYKNTTTSHGNTNLNFKYDEATKILMWHVVSGTDFVGIDLNMRENFRLERYRENQFPNSVSLSSPRNRIVEYDTSFTYGAGTSAANTIKLKACNYIYIYIENSKSKYFELYKTLRYRPGRIHILNLPNKDIIVWSLDVETRDDNELKTADVLHINYYSYHRNT